MSLPLPWVDRIFEKLTLVYGQAFLRRWQDIDLNAVKSDWCHELAGFAEHPQAISYGLQNLPADKPPTVLEFRALCRKAPEAEVPRLPEPKADPVRVAAELERLAPVRAAASREVPGRLDWARRIVARYEDGERLSRTTLRFAREALGIGA